ncbi:isoprenyl transferase [Saccharicrinis sp. FJH54]|uniref:isoprenyl transferase n=1 Tax=Saccharicrinis sp. FJH54 TaxID=3344665 RepID=UPI0035D3EEE1
MKKEESYKDKINLDNLPRHIAIIMDGNGRWAKKNGTDRIFGHKEGLESVKTITEAAAELNLGYLTLYAFSTENWGRPSDEVNALMELLVNGIDTEIENLVKNNIKLSTIGCNEMLPQHVYKKVENALKATSKNTGLVLTIALSYSSRWEIVHATQKLVKDALDGKFSAEQIDDTLLESYLTTNGMPDPELLIRTSGELRVSNFLLWQVAYSEFYFTDINWPDFKKEEFYKAIYEYQKRERRFGKTSEQIAQGNTK